MEIPENLKDDFNEFLENDPNYKNFTTALKNKHFYRDLTYWLVEIKNLWFNKNGRLAPLLKKHEAIDDQTIWDMLQGNPIQRMIETEKGELAPMVDSKTKKPITLQIRKDDFQSYINLQRSSFNQKERVKLIFLIQQKPTADEIELTWKRLHHFCTLIKMEPKYQEIFEVWIKGFFQFVKHILIFGRRGFRLPFLFIFASARFIQKSSFLRWLVHWLPSSLRNNMVGEAFSDEWNNAHLVKMITICNEPRGIDFKKSEKVKDLNDLPEVDIRDMYTTRPVKHQNVGFVLFTANYPRKNCPALRNLSGIRLLEIPLLSELKPALDSINCNERKNAVSENPSQDDGFALAILQAISLSVPAEICSDEHIATLMILGGDSKAPSDAQLWAGAICRDRGWVQLGKHGTPIPKAQREWFYWKDQILPYLKDDLKIAKPNSRAFRAQIRNDLCGDAAAFDRQQFSTKNFIYYKHKELGSAYQIVRVVVNPEYPRTISDQQRWGSLPVDAESKTQSKKLDDLSPDDPEFWKGNKDEK